MRPGHGVTVIASVAPVVKYSRAASSPPRACGFLMRPQLSSGTLRDYQVRGDASLHTMETLSEQPYYLFFILIATLAITSAYVRLLNDRVRAWPYIFVLALYLSVEAARFVFLHFLIGQPDPPPALAAVSAQQGSNDLHQYFMSGLQPIVAFSAFYRLALGLIYACAPALLTDVMRRVERRNTLAKNDVR